MELAHILMVVLRLQQLQHLVRQTLSITQNGDHALLTMLTVQIREVLQVTY